MKNIYTIPEDIADILNNGTEINEQYLKEFFINLEATLRKKLSKREPQKPTVRLSKIGTPDRKLYYELKEPTVEDPTKNPLKFLYGDIIEQLILLLIKHAGHTVENEQKEIVIDGIVGHTDCDVDGVAVDIKSTSSFAYRKFAKGELFNDDPFGYVAQLSAYARGEGKDKAAFIAVNKETGEICILDLHSIDMIDPVSRIRDIKSLLDKEHPPADKCYPEEPDGTSGNMKISRNCTYCPFKERCWKEANDGKGLRKFQYASEVRYLTRVESVPRVPELVNQEHKSS